MHEILISEGNDLLTKLKEASSQVDWDKDAAYDKLLEILKGVNQLIDMAEKDYLANNYFPGISDFFQFLDY